MDLLAHVEAGGLIARRAARGRAAQRRPRLDVPARRRACSWAHRPRRCTSTTRCARRPPPRRSTAARCAAGWRSSSRSSTPGRSRATRRRGRATCATPRARGWPVRAAPTSRRHTPRPTRSRRCCTGWPRRPGAARCSGWRRARGGWCGRCWMSRARRPPPGVARAAWAGARTPATRMRVFARARVREGLVPALRAVDARAEANILRTAALLRDEAEVLDAVVTTALAGRDRDLRRAPARAAAGARAARGAPAGRGRDRRAACRARSSRYEDLLAPGRRRSTSGDGARAVVERGVLPFRADAPASSPRFMRDGTADRRDPRPGR